MKHTPERIIETTAIIGLIFGLIAYYAYLQKHNESPLIIIGVAAVFTVGFISLMDILPLTIAKYHQRQRDRHLPPGEQIIDGHCRDPK